MRILFLSHTAPGGPFEVGSHHLARELSLMENQVWHVATQISPPQLIRVRPGGNVQTVRSTGRRFTDANGVRSMVPLAPLPARLNDSRAGALSRSVVRRAVRRFVDAQPDVVLVDQPLLGFLVAEFETAVVVYRPTDIAGSAAMRRAEGELAERCAGSVVTTPPVLDNLPGVLRQRPVLMLPNGVDFTRFENLPTVERSGAVYVGAIDERFDWPTVLSLAAANPSTPFDLYGPVLVRPPGPRPDNLLCHGAVAPTEVPAILSRAQVGLLPMNDEPWGAGRSPMKLYEYLAAGLVVVGTDLPHLSAIGLDELQLYGARRSPEECFATALSTTARNGGRDRAAAEGWPSKARQLLDFLDRLRDGR